MFLPNLNLCALRYLSLSTFHSNVLIFFCNKLKCTHFYPPKKLAAFYSNDNYLSRKRFVIVFLFVLHFVRLPYSRRAEDLPQVWPICRPQHIYQLRIAKKF